MPDSTVFASDALAGKVALVTGGGTGLGRASAVELAACGADVVIAGRREDVLASTAEEIGERASHVAGDIREDADARRMIGVALERHGRLDILVNNAGGQYFAPAEMVEWKGWNAVMRLNFDGTLRMAEAAHELAFAPAGGGTVLNVTLSPHHGMPGMVHSGAARAAVEALSRELAQRWASDHVTVIALAAGHFATPVLAKYPEQVQRSVASTPPLGRLGRDQEHGWLVAFCATEAGRALSGSTVTLDGARDNFLGPWPSDNLVDDAGNVPIEARRAVPPA
jgi:citronellol/citronellal dehydrogenase